MSRTKVLGPRREDAGGSVRADAVDGAEVPGVRDHAANVVRSDLFAIAATEVDGAGRDVEFDRAASLEPGAQVASDENGDRAMTRASEREVLSVEACAAFLGVDRKTVYDYAARGVIPCRRLGKRILFSRQMLVLWLGGACSKGLSNGETR